MKDRPTTTRAEALLGALLTAAASAGLALVYIYRTGGF